MKFHPSLLLCCAALTATACSTTPSYEDPDAVYVAGNEFGFSDLHLIAEQMTNSFLATDAWGGEKPRIVFGGIQNATNQHIDTRNITDTIRTALIQSGKFTVLAGEQGIGEIQAETGYQQSGAVDLASAVELGRQSGAEYVFYGRFTTLASVDGNTKEVYYKFTMNSVNAQTREIAWAEEKRIRKREKKSLFGW